MQSAYHKNACIE